MRVCPRDTVIMENWETLGFHGKRMDVIVRMAQGSLRTAFFLQKRVREHKGATGVDVTRHLPDST